MILNQMIFLVINDHKEIPCTITIRFPHRETLLLVCATVNLGNFLKQISPGSIVVSVATCKSGSRTTATDLLKMSWESNMFLYTQDAGKVKTDAPVGFACFCRTGGFVVW